MMTVNEIVKESADKDNNIQDILEDLNRYHGILPTDKVDYAETMSHSAGTGYRKVIYRIEGRPDAFCVDRKYGSANYVSFYVEEGFFDARRAYAQQCGKASRKYRVPFELCLALSPEFVPVFKQHVRAIRKIRRNDSEYADWLQNELCCGIARRTRAILETLQIEPAPMVDDEGVYNADIGLLYKIEACGQKNNERIASYVYKLLK